MKKSITLLLALSLLGNAGCSNSTETTLNEQTEAAYSETDISEDQMIEASIEPVDSVQIQEPEDSYESADDTASEEKGETSLPNSFSSDSDEIKVFSFTDLSFMSSFQALLEDLSYKVWEAGSFLVAPELIKTSNNGALHRNTYKFFISETNPDDYYALIVEATQNNEVDGIIVMTNWYIMADSLKESASVHDHICDVLFAPLGAIENCNTQEEVNALWKGITLKPSGNHNPSIDYYEYQFELDSCKAKLIAASKTGTVLTISPK